MESLFDICFNLPIFDENVLILVDVQTLVKKLREKRKYMVQKKVW